MGKEVENSYTFNENCEVVLGINDKNIPYLEKILSSQLYLKGDTIYIEKPNPLFVPLFEHLEDFAFNRDTIDESDIFKETEYVKNSLIDFVPEEKISILSKTIYPKSKNQNDFISSLRSKKVVFLSGPAGSGKTFLSISFALEEIFEGRKNKIILTRPTLEAGESLGYLPGDLEKKLDPYLKPFYDSMEYFITPKEIKKLEEDGKIEISPLSYMRGRTFNNAIAILDEGQNTTKSQMKMFLTRLGESSNAIVLGDEDQSDLGNGIESGFREAVQLLSRIEGIKVVHFNYHDTFRSKIVREIVRAYGEKYNE